MHIRALREAELGAVAALVARLQTDPVAHIGYLDREPSAIAAQLTEIEPRGLTDVLVAVDEGPGGPDGPGGTDGPEGTGERIVGLLAAEWDTEPPRVWWHGPLVTDAERWDEIADALYASQLARLPDTVREQELFHDARSDRLARFAARHGFHREPASAVLSRPLDGGDGDEGGDAVGVPAPPDGIGIGPLEDRDRNAVARLHAACFPTAHLPGNRLDEGPRRAVLVARRDGEVVGYVAVERQHDGQGYLDFLAVVPEERGRGIGAALIVEAMAWCRTQGSVGVHLTVREENVTARALYERLGFTEEMLAVPWRLGVTMAPPAV